MNKRFDIRRSVREWLWPSMGWSRARRYYMHRVSRLTATPHAIAMGFACGAFASFTPFMGFHLLLCMGLACLLRGDVIASIIGTVVGNPITFPIIWLATYQTGNMLLGKGEPTTFVEATFENSPDLWALPGGSLSQAWPVLSSMSVGGLVLGIPAAILCYAVVRIAVAGFKRKRREALSNATRRRLRVTKFMTPSAG